MVTLHRAVWLLAVCVKSRANGRNIVGQQLPTLPWMLHVASVCTPCCMSLDVLACCCAKFEICQTFQPTTLNIVGATKLGVVASVCTQP